MLYSSTFWYAGYEIEAAIDDDGNQYVSYRTVEKTLNWRADNCRKKLGSKSFKAFVGKGYTVGKKLDVTDKFKYKNMKKHLNY